MNIKTHSYTSLQYYTHSATYLVTRNAVDYRIEHNVVNVWFSDPQILLKAARGRCHRCRGWATSMRN